MIACSTPLPRHLQENCHPPSWSSCPSRYPPAQLLPCKIRSWDGCLLFFWQAHLQMRPACLPRQGPVQPSPPASITESRVQRPKGTFVYIQQNAGGCDETPCFFRPRRAGGVTWGLRLCYHPRTTCAQRWVTSLRLHPPHPHLFLVGHKHLWVLPASLACCHLPPAAAAPAWVLPPPSGPGVWSAVLHTRGRSLPAMASTITSLPPRHSRGSSLRT